MALLYGRRTPNRILIWQSMRREEPPGSSSIQIDYASRVKKLNLQTLKQRRFMAYVIFLYKALNGYLIVDLSKNSHFYSMHHARFWWYEG